MHQIVEFIEQIIFKNKYESLFIKLFSTCLLPTYITQPILTNISDIVLTTS